MDLLEIKSNDVKEAWFIKIMCMLQREIEKQIYLEDGCKKNHVQGGHGGSVSV